MDFIIFDIFYRARRIRLKLEPRMRHTKEKVVPTATLSCAGIREIERL
jgi:hypothetical protein